MNESSTNPKLFNQEISPIRQLIAALVAIPVFTILFYLPGWIGLMNIKSHQVWTISASMLLMFALCNSVLSLSSDDVNKYWNKSIYSFVILAVSGALFAWVVSGLSIYEAKSFKWIYTVFTFGYLFFLSIITLMRKIVMLAQRQDKRLRGESDND